jgi:hypothetical protein
MSMHEYEDLVESSIRELSTSGESQQRLRSLYFSLFEFEALFDTGFTHFRSMDLLLQARFVYTIPLEEHPEFFAHGPYFQDVKRSDKKVTFIKLPGKGSDGSYYSAPHLYFDAGSILWRRLVELGRLSDADAEPPENIDVMTIALEVARLAERKGDPGLIGQWYRLLAPYILETELDELKQDPELGELRTIVKRTDALAVKSDYGMLRDPGPEDFEELPALGWWFEVG